MGLHYHVRVCVNGTKNHSTGTWNKSINEDLLKNNNPLQYKGGNPYFRDSEVKHMTFLFFRRHRNHARRTLTNVIAYELENGIVTRRLVWVPISDDFREHDISDEFGEKWYNDLGKIQYFSSSMLDTFVRNGESVTITNYNVDPDTGNRHITTTTISTTTSLV